MYFWHYGQSLHVAVPVTAGVYTMSMKVTAVPLQMQYIMYL